MSKKPSSYTDPATISALQAAAAATGNDYRALVCVFLFGGNDSHNMIVPMAGSTNRAPYDFERGSLAVAANTLLPATTNWGFHPSLSNMKARWDEGKLATLMNVGVLQQPLNKAARNSGTVPLPSQLYSHNSQTEQWQSLPEYQGLVMNGFMGRAEDLVGSVYNPDPGLGLNSLWSVFGRRTQMQGYDAGSNDMSTLGASALGVGTANGSSLSTGTPSPLTLARTQQSWGNKLQVLMANRVSEAISRQAGIASLLPTLSATPEGRFTAVASNNLAQQLKTVARIIAGRAAFGHRRDMFFVGIGGWDDHAGLVANYGPRLTTLDTALQTFWAALGDLGVQENVITYTQSEFGRSLRRNEAGSDHGWGGHALILGGAVNGGVIYGQEPDLTPGSTIDDGQGRLIPTTSVEQYVGALLEWWGVPQAQLPLILPNFENFTPRVLPGLTRAPASIVTAAPALDLDLVSSLETTGRLPSIVTFSRDAGPATYIDENGSVRDAKSNFCENSEAVGLEPKTFLANSSPTPGNAAYSPWYAIVNADSGLGIEFVGRGVEDGKSYVDIRFFGTNTTGITRYPGVRFTSVVANSIVTASGESWRVGFDLKRLKSAGSFSHRPYLVAQVNDVNGGVVGGQASITVGITEGAGFDKPEQMYGRITSTVSTAVRVNAELRPEAVIAGATIEETYRVYQPRLTRAGVSPVPEYIPTTGTPVVSTPRLDYTPGTRVAGFLVERAAANFILNSMMVGAASGVPGTLPTDWVAPSGPAGINYCVARTGSENNLQYIDIRVFGKTASAGDWTLPFMTTPAAVTAGGNWYGGTSCFARLVGGSFSNVTAVDVETVGTIAGAPTQVGSGSLLKIDGRPLSQQRRYSFVQFTNASVNGAISRLKVTPVQNQYVDFTIRIAAPQLETQGGATMMTSFVPTFGAYTATRPADNANVTGANFTSWFNPAAGTFIIDSAGPPAESRMGAGSYPAQAQVDDGTASNRIYMAHSATSDTGNGRRTLRVDLAGVSQGESLTPLGSASVGPRAASYAGSYQVGSTYKACMRSQFGSAITPITGYPSGLNRLSFSPTQVVMRVRSLRYYNTVLTDSQMAALTAN